ncbi:MAG: methyltransferase regulatory domain-containing protein [Gemmataceae bacterium]
MPQPGADVDASFGTFDYIVAHGVYSWVPEPVRDALLRVCRENLPPQGVAYVSYNTCPGWYLRAPVRDLLTFHAEGVDDPHERVRRGRELLAVVAANPLHPDSAWAKLIRDEADLLAKEGDYYLFHEHLEPDNHPVYFHQFLAHAQRHDLQFLAESQRHTTLALLPPPLNAKLTEVAANPLELEQYVDYASGRSFRRSLLVHDEVPLDPRHAPLAVVGMLLCGTARPAVADADVTTVDELEFVNEDGATATVTAPVVKAALTTLYETWPRVWRFEELLDAAGARVGQTREQAAPTLARALAALFQANFVGLHSHVPPFVLKPGKRPETTPLIRLQAQTGVGVCNRRHKLVELATFDRAVLALLDGSRDRPALIERLAALVGQGELGLAQDGQPVREPEAVRRTLTAELDESLTRLAQAMVLIG